MMIQFVQKFKITKSVLLHAVMAVVASAAFVVVSYWLLPVAPQSQLAADTVRWAMASTDRAPVVEQTLNGPWTLIVAMMRGSPINHNEIFATAAAIDGWLSLAALGLLSMTVPWWITLLVAISPCLLWSALMPTGAGLIFFMLAFTAFCAQRKPAIAPFCAGATAALTPVIWLSFLAALVKRRGRWEKTAIKPAALGVAGFVLVILISLVDTEAFALIPALSALRSVFSGTEDHIAAASFLFGGLGESAVILSASLIFYLGLIVGGQWRSTPQNQRRLGAAAFAVFALSFFVRDWSQWKIIYPGWNIVAYEAARSLELSVRGPTVALMPTHTEEAIFRYHMAVVKSASKFPLRVEAVTAGDVGRPDVQSRLKKLAPDFEFSDLSLNGLLQNTKKGLAFWLAAPPEARENLNISILGYGFRAVAHDGSTHFDFDLESLQKTFVRALMTGREYQWSRPLEARIFERYGNFHMAKAHVLSRQKQPVDWERRAMAEEYAALKKVNWLVEPYQHLCVEKKEAARPPEIVELCQQVQARHNTR